jgi:hypothetical protein
MNLVIDKFAKTYIGLFLKNYCMKLNLVKKNIVLIKARGKTNGITCLVNQTIYRFRRHLSLKKESMDKMMKAVKAQLEDIKEWERHFRADKQPIVRYKMSNHPELFKE